MSAAARKLDAEARRKDCFAPMMSEHGDGIRNNLLVFVFVTARKVVDGVRVPEADVSPAATINLAS